MELNFLGRGAAFNPKEGNTSAFFIDNNELFLIDCGESIFKEIIENNILNNIEKINIMITHTHCDHIGSIGSLIMYSYYKLNNKVNIIVPKEKKEYISNLLSIINLFGCSKDMYNTKYDIEYSNKYNVFQHISFVTTKHVDNLECFSIVFNTKDGIIFYSGDTKEINLLIKIINSNQKIDKIYIDTTTDNYPNNAHLNIEIIHNNIPFELKNKVYCMHINNYECIKLIEKYGFNIVKIYKL